MLRGTEENYEDFSQYKWPPGRIRSYISVNRAPLIVLSHKCVYIRLQDDNGNRQEILRFVRHVTTVLLQKQHTAESFKDTDGLNTTLLQER